MHTPPSRDPNYRQQEAAANVIRSQIDAIYSGRAPSTIATAAAQQAVPSAATTQPEPQSPYTQTHTPATEIQPDSWAQYHSAWQDYYKKYYEGYYTHALTQARDTLAKDLAAPSREQPVTTGSAVTSSKTASHDDPAPEPEKTTGITRQKAMQELKASLLASVESSAHKVRGSKHFVPILATLGVLVIFGFLQYNQLLIANVKAYITPGSIDPQNIIVDPSSNVVVGPEPRLIIPKINVDTPVFYDIPIDKASQDRAMENGVAHFAIPGASSHPGQVGNTVLSGHSSNDVFAAGDYKFIFMQLDKLEIGDTIYANYEGVRYTYIVTGKEEVLPSQVDKLIYPTDKPVMTLITCTPLGTALKRLLVTAEQVHPSPAGAVAAPVSNNAQGATSIPGQGQPSVLERMFGS